MMHQKFPKGFQAVRAGQFVKAELAPVQAAPFSNPIAHPLGPPTIANTNITIDLMLQQPTRITRFLMDITLQRFFVDRVFASGGGVTGGAIIYDELVANDLYADRDVKLVQPGAEFPEITFSRRAPKVATVEKWGGKFWFTDEARDRNDATAFARAMTQLGNTIVRKINQRGVAVLNTFLSAHPERVFVGNNWSTVVTGGASQTNAPGWPQRDIARADFLAEVDEMGMAYDLIILNPQEMFNLQTVYGDDLGDLLASYNKDVYVTNRQPAGEMLVLASGQVGEMRVEQPLATETWRDPHGKQQTWVQSSVRPLFFADNAFAMIKITGLNG
jgi:hypothetical protein